MKTPLVIVLLQLMLLVSNGKQQEVVEEGEKEGALLAIESNIVENVSSTNGTNAKMHQNLIKCSRQSMLLARQTLIHQLELINVYNAIWFNDLDKDELIEEQKHSLGNIIMSGLSNQLLSSDGQPTFEIESSYFRSITLNSVTSRMVSHLPASGANGDHNNLQHTTQLPIEIKLVRRHQDRCHMNREKGHFVYVFGLALGPIEHNLDLVYNLPRELRLSQPIEWRYAQVRIRIPRMLYEVTMKQNADYQLKDKSCPLEVMDLTYSPVSSTAGSTQPTIIHSGLSETNQTKILLERLFSDYTRPAVSSRLRQVLKFHLSSKTLPLMTNIEL